MAKSYWLINSESSEVKRFMKNDKSIDGVFEYMFIDTGKIVGGLGDNPPVITNTVSVEIDLAREIYERLLSCLLYTSPSPRDGCRSRMPSSA